MSKNIPVARVNATGALVRLTDANRDLVLGTQGMVETVAEADPITGRLVEVNGADYTTMIAASEDLQRIGQALLNNAAQRETLLTSALKIQGAETYLTSIGMYDPETDSAYLNQSVLNQPVDANIAPSAPMIENVTDELKATAKKKKAATKAKSRKPSPDELADL